MRLSQRRTSDGDGVWLWLCSAKQGSSHTRPPTPRPPHLHTLTSLTPPPGRVSGGSMAVIKKAQLFKHSEGNTAGEGGGMHQHIYSTEIKLHARQHRPPHSTHLLWITILLVEKHSYTVGVSVNIACVVKVVVFCCYKKVRNCHNKYMSETNPNFFFFLNIFDLSTPLLFHHLREGTC